MDKLRDLLTVAQPASTGYDIPRRYTLPARDYLNWLGSNTPHNVDQIQQWLQANPEYNIPVNFPINAGLGGTSTYQRWPSRVNVSYPSPNPLIKEWAHHRDWQERGALKTTAHAGGSLLSVLLKSIELGIPLDKMFRLSYKTPGYFEYRTHKEIEPKLLKEIRNQ